jgi:hypothetical protein
MKGHFQVEGSNSASSVGQTQVVKDGHIIMGSSLCQHRQDFSNTYTLPCQNAFFDKRELELGNKRLPQV